MKYRRAWVYFEIGAFHTNIALLSLWLLIKFNWSGGARGLCTEAKKNQESLNFEIDTGGNHEFVRDRIRGALKGLEDLDIVDDTIAAVETRDLDSTKRVFDKICARNQKIKEKKIEICGKEDVIGEAPLDSEVEKNAGEYKREDYELRKLLVNLWEQQFINNFHARRHKDIRLYMPLTYVHRIIAKEFIEPDLLKSLEKAGDMFQRLTATQIALLLLSFYL